MFQEKTELGPILETIPGQRDGQTKQCSLSCLYLNLVVEHAFESLLFFFISRCS